MKTPFRIHSYKNLMERNDILRFWRSFLKDLISQIHIQNGPKATLTWFNSSSLQFHFRIAVSNPTIRHMGWVEVRIAGEVNVTMALFSRVLDSQSPPVNCCPHCRRCLLASHSVWRWQLLLEDLYSFHLFRMPVRFHYVVCVSFTRKLLPSFSSSGSYHFFSFLLKSRRWITAWGNYIPSSRGRKSRIILIGVISSN